MSNTETATVTQTKFAHYNSSLPLKLESDAMPYRVGAVKSHVMPNGDENPIAFGSQTLSKAERKKPCTSRKRSLGDCFQHKKLYEFIYGQRLILVNDHKPLTTIFSPKAVCQLYQPQDCRDRPSHCQDITMMLNFIQHQNMLMLIVCQDYH